LGLLKSTRKKPASTSCLLLFLCRKFTLQAADGGRMSFADPLFWGCSSQQGKSPHPLRVCCFFYAENSPCKQMNFLHKKIPRKSVGFFLLV
jgi:hypothetical protein